MIKLKLIESLLISKYNPNDIARSLRNIGLSYSFDDLNKISSEFFDSFKQWNMKSNYSLHRILDKYPPKIK